jgi:hypothetical protein
MSPRLDRLALFLVVLAVCSSALFSVAAGARTLHHPAPGTHHSARTRSHRTAKHQVRRRRHRKVRGHHGQRRPAPVKTSTKPTSTNTGATAPATTPTPPAGSPGMPFLRTSGTQIVDSAGNTVRLRGVNLGGWLLWEGWIFGGGYTGESAIVNRLASLVGTQAAQQFHSDVQNDMIQESDIAQIARLGFTVVRVPFNYRLLEDPTQPGVYKASGWALLDNLVSWGQKYHVYIVLDMHAAPGGQGLGFIYDDPTGPLLWNSPQSQRDMIATWRAIAARYSGNSAIAGYDLLNEPWGSAQDLSSIYAQTIAAIRSVDPNHMIFLEGAQDSRDFSYATAPLDPDIVYSPHMYLWSQTNAAQQLSTWAQLAAAQNVPLWIGEFGEDFPSSDAKEVAMFAAQSTIAGWSFWTWKQTGWGVYSIQTTPAWQALINWLCDTSAPAPTVAQATQGMQDFLASIQLQNETPNTAVESALTGAG